MEQPKESLIGMVMHNGTLCQMTTHADGSTTYTPENIDEHINQSISERFKNTDTAPQDWNPPEEETDTHPIQDWNPQTNSTLQLSVPHTRDDHIKISIKVEALLTMIFDGTPVDCKGNLAFKEVLKSLCTIMGDDWKNKIKDIK